MSRYTRIIKIKRIAPKTEPANPEAGWQKPRPNLHTNIQTLKLIQTYQHTNTRWCSPCRRWQHGIKQNNMTIKNGYFDKSDKYFTRLSIMINHDKFNIKF